MKSKRLLLSIVMLLVSAVLLSSASFAWFSINTSVEVGGVYFESYSDEIFLEISKKSDGDFDYSVDFSDEKSALRPISRGYLSDSNAAYLVTFAEASGNYDPTAGVSYYLKADKASQNDSRVGPDYLCIDSKLKGASSVAGYYSFTDGAIAFELITSGAYASGTYYEKEMNSYVPATLSVGDDLYGYYKIDVTSTCPDGTLYESGKVYYELRDGGYHPVGGLELGTGLRGYYVVDTETKATLADGTSTYYLKNSSGDYISLGKPESGVSLDSTYSYWYKGYSSKIEDPAVDSMSAVLDETKYPETESPYYCLKTVYLRMKNKGGGENLRVSSVTVHGTDSLDEAVRIYFVATNGAGEVAYATYNAKTGEIDHGPENCFFKTILPNGEEIIEVKMYVYYDGTSETVKSHKDIILTGHSISLNFDIDKPYYAEYMD